MAPTVVIHGEAGIGKTRTVAQFARWARADADVLWGSVYEGGVGPPYEPWMQALSSREAAGQAASRGGVRRGVLAPRLLGRHVFPVASDSGEKTRDDTRQGLADVVGLQQAADAATGPDGARVQLFDAVVRKLDEREEASVLVLDNLERAGADTLELLRYVVRTGLRHILIVLIFRGAALAIEHPLSSALAELRRTRAVEDITLASLQPNEAAELLSHVAQCAVDPELAEAVLYEGNGNPFFITEIGRELRRHGALVGFGTPDWRPPASIRQAVALRLAGLSTPTAKMLELASAFTSGFAFEDLAAVCDTPEDVSLDALDEALGAELLRSDEAGRYDFAQSLVQQTLYDEFSPSRRARIHRKIASVIEQRHASNLAGVATQLAMQYHQSLGLPGAEAGLPHALTAAHQCRAANAPRRAVVFLQQALDLAPEEDLAVRADIAGQLAIAEAEATLFDEAPRSLETALAMLDGSGASCGAIADLVYRTSSILQDAMTDQETLEPAIQRGLAALGGARDLAWARLKLLERPRQLLTAGPLETYRWLGFDSEAVSLARSEGDELDHARTLQPLDPWTPAELISTAKEIRGWRDPRARLRGLDVVAHGLCCGHGVTPGTSGVVAELTALAERFGAQPARSLALMYEGMVRGAGGELHGAITALWSAQALAEQAPQTGQLQAAIDLMIALTSRNRDPDWPALASLMEHHARRSGGVLWLRLALAALAALAFIEAGRPVDGADLLREIVPDIQRCEPWDYAQNCAASLAGDAAAKLGDVDLAGELVEPCLALVEREVGDYYMTSTELTLARLFMALGQRQESLLHLAGARARATAQGQRPIRAIIDYEQWSMTRDSGRTNGTDPLTTLVAQFSELGMLDWVRRATEPEVVATAPPDGLTRREVDVLRLIATGKTNREIADALTISIYTVERHVHNAYAKLAVRNRADATAYVIRHAL
jgi:DNA-binding CsgD family transcriptional regulator